MSLHKGVKKKGEGGRAGGGENNDKKPKTGPVSTQRGGGRVKNSGKKSCGVSVQKPASGSQFGPKQKPDGWGQKMSDQLAKNFTVMSAT